MKTERGFKVEVIADSSGNWAGNGLTFETASDAETYAKDLARRWTLVSDWRIVEVCPELDIIEGD
jgi:hypothetical protein